MANPNEHQIKLAALLEVDISCDTELTAAARLEDSVASAIHPGEQLRPVTGRQIAFGHSLSLALSKDSFRVASTKIDEELRARNIAALNDLDLKPGDRVIKRQRVEIDGQSHSFDREHVVSSIGKNLRVWFKGGNGQGAWPTQVEKAGE